MQSTHVVWVLSFVLTIWSQRVFYSSAFTPSQTLSKFGNGFHKFRSKDSRIFALTELVDSNDEQNPQVSPMITCRRSVIQSVILSSTFASVLSILEGSIVVAEAVTGDRNEIDFDCLRDLPPVTKDCVRVYLCRHGQTENNRLHLVQGARVDPPLNDTGRQQATRIGRALSRIDSSQAPTTIRHSQLERAKETARVAGQSYYESKRTVGTNREERTSNEILLPSKELPSLGEIDFGPVVEGKLSTEVKAKMTKVYASWSLGLIDEKGEAENGESGESARDIFLRIESALESLSETSSPILAVSHSTYIRMLLGILLEIPLAEAALLEQKKWMYKCLRY